MVDAKPALRIGLEYGSLLTHLVDPAKVESGRLGDRGGGVVRRFLLVRLRELGHSDGRGPGDDLLTV